MNEIEEKTLNYIRFATGFNNLKMEQLEMFVENEVEEINGYNTSTQEFQYRVADINTNATLRAYIIECLDLTLQTRWGNNLEYHVERKTKYLNKLTGMQA